jgi:hypothetical protein
MRASMLQIARALAVKLQGLDIAKSDLLVLNQAIKCGKPGLLADAVQRCRKWERIAEKRVATITRNVAVSSEKAFQARLLEGLANQAKPLFPLNKE